MKLIKKYVDEIHDEVEGAKEYAEQYIEARVKGDTNIASRYKEMASDELKHATYVHEFAVKEIENVSKIYTPPVEMMEEWERAHKKFVEEVAWIRHMLEM